MIAIPPTFDEFLQSSQLISALIAGVSSFIVETTSYATWMAYHRPSLNSRRALSQNLFSPSSVTIAGNVTAFYMLKIKLSSDT